MRANWFMASVEHSPKIDERPTERLVSPGKSAVKRPCR